MSDTFIDIIAGARPNFMKISSIIRALDAQDDKKEKLHYRLVHTGQHYDPRLSGIFFDQLKIPRPDISLDVGSCSQAEQVGGIMIAYEKLLQKSPSNLCLVVGDVNSTMACAITAQKMSIPVAHVEAGIRSGDWNMPEEINRMVTDSITNWFFTTSEFANKNLYQLGIGAERVFFVGNTMIDTLLENKKNFVPPKFWDEYNLEKQQYFVLTLHRPSNVDNKIKLLDTIKTILGGSADFNIIFAAHPRTAKVLKNVDLGSERIFTVEPQPYFEFNYLVENAMAVITDSGGVTEECTVMGVPCLTLRETTERPETVIEGTNELIGTSPAALLTALDKVINGKWKKGNVPALWDGRAGNRIVQKLRKILLTSD